MTNLKIICHFVLAVFPFSDMLLMSEFIKVQMSFGWRSAALSFDKIGCALVKFNFI